MANIVDVLQTTGLVTRDTLVGLLASVSLPFPTRLEVLCAVLQAPDQLTDAQLECLLRFVQAVPAFLAGDSRRNDRALLASVRNSLLTAVACPCDAGGRLQTAVGDLCLAAMTAYAEEAVWGVVPTDFSAVVSRCCLQLLMSAGWLFAGQHCAGA